MAKTKYESIIRRKLEVTPYGHTNETMNRLMGDDTVFVVQGPYGRMPIIADTEDEAIDRYVVKVMKRIEEDEELSVTDKVE